MSSRDPQPVCIETLHADDWELLKTLRLRALRDAPDAFGPTAEEAEGHSDAYWQRGARALAATGIGILVARLGGEPVGLVSAVTDDAGVGHIGAMWVADANRGKGIGARLLDAALDALDVAGCASVELSVTEGNRRAIALYESRGFRPTGAWQPLRAGSPLRNLTLLRSGSG